MTAEREGLAETIAAHELLSGHTSVRRKRRFVAGYVCKCGHVEVEVEDANYQDLYAAHLADALADLLAARDRRVRAEAWDEGWQTGQLWAFSDLDEYGKHANPHRIEVTP